MKLKFLLIIFLSAFQSIAAITLNTLKWQKFDSLEDELPVVEMKINNQKVRAFFDTGANTITMGEQTAEKLGLQMERHHRRCGFASSL